MIEPLNDTSGLELCQTTFFYRESRFSKGGDYREMGPRSYLLIQPSQPIIQA
jgi:hypothetical protein